MHLRPLIVSGLLAAALSASANAAELRLGLHTEAVSVAAPDFNGPAFLPGVDFSATWPLTDGLNLRSTVSAQLPGVLRTDSTILTRGEVYFGGGLGAGILLSSDNLVTALSPLALLNLHAVLGRNFGPLQLEAYARGGLVYGAGVRLSYLLNAPADALP